MKKFITRVVLLLVILLAAMYAIQFSYYKNNPDDSDTKKFYNMPYGIQIANVGNSHGECSFDYSGIEDEYTCFNFALTGQSIEYDENILNQYINRMDKDSVMIIPVSYVSFFLSDWDLSEEDFTVKNLRYYGILNYSNMLRTDLFEYIKRKYFTLIFTDIRADMLANANSAVFGDEIESEKENPVNINFEQDAVDAYYRHVESFYVDGEYQFKDELIECLYNMIELCKKKEVTPILVTTPYAWDYNNLVEEEFLIQFNDIISEVVNNTGVEYYDYSKDERFENNYELFLNSDHLNKKGAVEFTNIFYEECVKK